MSGPNQTEDRRGAAIAAALLLVGFGLLAAFMPRIMLALGSVSPWLAMAAAAGFIVLPFAALAWRGRWQRRREEKK